MNLPTLNRAVFVVLAALLVCSPAFAKGGSDITQFGHDIRISEDQKAGEVTCFACSVYVRGQVSGDITTFGGSVVLDPGTMVAGEITSFWGDVRAAEDTKIAGDVSVFGGRLRRQPSTMISGEVTTFQSRGLIWLMLLSPFVVLAGIIALIIWLVRSNRRPSPVMARAA
jgi:hypothetical protein